MDAPPITFVHPDPDEPRARPRRALVAELFRLRHHDLVPELGQLAVLALSC
jgi:hypothetical protein